MTPRAPAPARPMNPPQHIWYFAYGSNLSSSTLTDSRGITPLTSARVSLPGWTLAFTIPGLPYREPVFASITPRPNSDNKTNTCIPDVTGVAYLLTAAQYTRLVASEGGGAVYASIPVAAVPVGAEDARRLGGEGVVVWTLTTGLLARKCGRPSARYMDIIEDGAAESGLPVEYRGYLAEVGRYEGPRGLRRRLGAALFLAVWVPVMSIVHRLVEMTIGIDGLAPPGVRAVVRAVFVLMWLWHDYVHAPVWGRGDGAEECNAKGKC
ncbi:hypothetical protein FN846DRAFT_969630 [Sphaerosporella brunnea]|uniref:gamma-glutamylcyclotransferase n=1 Tax=Sphaerosporella brunnea TaxID=1250544 RepID=A0A5J5EIB6_9PEZI|nr:hypothetical protein FN846DRAFT_969630 [Sphaerosporella brunnea]